MSVIQYAYLANGIDAEDVELHLHPIAEDRNFSHKEEAQHIFDFLRHYLPAETFINLIELFRAFQFPGWTHQNERINK